MSDLPENWIDKIFELMQEFYGERWKNQFKKPVEIEIFKTMWFNGLNGLTYDQIRHGLAVSKKYASSSYSKPPSVVIFYHYCIGLRVEHVSRRTQFDHK